MHRYELIHLDADGLGWGVLYREVPFGVSRDELRSVRVSPDGQTLTFLLVQGPLSSPQVVVLRRGAAPEELYWKPVPFDQRPDFGFPGDGGVAPWEQGDGGPWGWGMP